MKLKIKFTSAALAMTLLAMAGASEAAFLSSMAWLDMTKLSWEIALPVMPNYLGVAKKTTMQNPLPVILAARPQTRVKAA